MLLLNQILTQAQIFKATDIHLAQRQSDFQLSYREGRNTKSIENLSPVKGQELLEYLYFLTEICVEKNHFKNFYHLSFSFEKYSLRASLSLKPKIYLTLRLHQKKSTALLHSDLDELKEYFQERFFLVIYGKINSGKTTAYYNILNYLSQTKKNTLVSCEDPIEREESFWQVSLNQHEQWLELKEHLLRFDLDCIGFGEIRKKRYFSEARSLFYSGHNIICTAHALDEQRWLDEQSWIDQDLKSHLIFLHAENKKYKVHSSHV